jgi:Domain of unknown function (DUF5666)
MSVAQATRVMFVVWAFGVQGRPLLTVSALSRAQSQESSSATTTRRIGAVKAINGSSLTLSPDSGPETVVTVLPTTRIVRVAPGEKNLKNAVPAPFSDLEVGDRILVGGQASDDSKSITASSIVVMKHSAVEARKEQDRQDWQKRGLGGLVSSVDPATGTVTISVSGFAGAKTVAVHTSKATIIRRYAPDSVKFDDAKPGSFEEIHAGDQLRARGDRSPDGSEMAAEEIVSGSFRNIAGTVNSVDASAGTISVQDLLSKKNLLVRVTGDSQLRSLPGETAQRIAMRLKGAMARGTSGSPAGANPAAANTESQAGASPSTPGGGGTNGGRMRSAGSADFQQILNRMPAITITDLHKGDAVLIVSTRGAASDPGGTAITLVSGVEPILQAAPNAGQAMMLAPWNLGGTPGGDAGTQ